MPDPQHRAADADREAVAATLGRALSDGRLTVDEYDERLVKAYAAQTYGELSPLTADLPPTGSVRRPADPVAGRVAGPWSGATSAPLGGPAGGPAPVGTCGSGAWSRGGARSVWASWVTTSLIVTAIWLATSIGHGGAHDFWPIWVIVPWGAVLLGRTITGRPGQRRHERHRRLR